MAHVKIFLPEGPEIRSKDPASLAQRIQSFEGSTIGVVNNMWACMDVLTAMFMDMLPRRYGVKRVLEERVSPTAGLSEATAGIIAKGWDAAIVGIGH